MDFVRELCSSIHAARKAIGIPTVQPLQSVVLYKSEEIHEFILSLYSKIIAEECNIKEVTWEIIFEGDRESFGIHTMVSLNYREAGKVFALRTQEIGKLIRSGGFSVLAEGITLDDDTFIENTFIEMKQSIDNESNQKKNYFVGTIGKSFFVLDTLITPLLYLEKLAQGVVKLINKERRDRGFQVGDSVDVLLNVTDEHFLALDHNMEMVMKNAKCKIMTYPSDTLSVSTMKAQ